MRKQDAVDHFGSQKALADALGIKQSSVAEWGEFPPEPRQLQIQKLTNGGLRAEPDVIAKFGDPSLGDRAAA